MHGEIVRELLDFHNQTQSSYRSFDTCRWCFPARRGYVYQMIRLASMSAQHNVQDHDDLNENTISIFKEVLAPWSIPKAWDTTHRSETWNSTWSIERQWLRKDNMQWGHQLRMPPAYSRHWILRKPLVGRGDSYWGNLYVSVMPKESESRR